MLRVLGFADYMRVFCLGVIRGGRPVDGGGEFAGGRSERSGFGIIE
jgi:hypothetical protein